MSQIPMNGSESTDSVLKSENITKNSFLSLLQEGIKKSQKIIISSDLENYTSSESDSDSEDTVSNPSSQYQESNFSSDNHIYLSDEESSVEINKSSLQNLSQHHHLFEPEVLIETYSTCARRLEIDDIPSDQSRGEYVVHLDAETYLQCGRGTLMFFSLYWMSKYDCHFIDKLCMMYPWDIEDNDIVLIRDNINAYQLQFNLSEFYKMDSNRGSPMIQVCTSEKIPEYASEAIRKNFTKKSEFTATDQQSDANETSVKTGDGGNSSTNDAKKSSVEKRVSIADVKKRAREKRALVKDITIEIYDPYEKASSSKTIERMPTGLITNIAESKEHFCVWDPNYPENPNRLQSVIDKFHAYGLYNRCEILPQRPATKEEILVAHSKNGYNLLEEYSVPSFQDDYETFSSKYDAVFVNEYTYTAAIFAAGCCIELVDAIMTNKIQNGFAAVRPPGHHAMHDEYNGYCFFNNAVIAANYAINKFETKRILIVDFDVHHGQGTQDHFYKSNNVLYFSIHRYEFGSFWPNLRRSDFDYIGENDGKGFNFNVPLNEIGMTDADYLTIFNTVLMPVAYEYDPELVIISAGYDAANGCPEGQMKVSPQCYAHMTHLLQTFAQGKVAVLLEGGYNITSLAEGAALTLRALLDDPVPRLPHPHLTPKTSLLKTLRNLILHQKPYWKCFDLYTGVPDAVQTSPEVYEEKLTVYPTRDAYPKVPQGLEGLVIHLEILETITTKIKPYLKIPAFKLLILYDKTMLKHNSRDGIVPLENPSRIKQSFDLLKSFGLVDRAVVISGSRLENFDAFNKVHSEDYISTLKDVIKSGNDKAFTSIYTNEHTLECALMAVGSSLNLLDRVMEGDCATALALIRPPGHHAEPNEAMGFCFFNNVAIVAQQALEHYKLNRVLIVDFDIHHPNGTFTIFKNDNRCLLISIHRYHPNFFPHTGELTEVGESDGIGFNVNIPWTQKGQGDQEYLAAFLRIILPISRQFDPELVLVSAGFDAAIGDPLGQCNVSPEMFGHMAHMLKEVSSGRLLFFLEGGYNVTSVSHSIGMVAKALLGDPLVSISLKTTINDDAAKVIESVIQHQIKYWPILNLDPIKSTSKSKTCVVEEGVVKEPVLKESVVKEPVAKEPVANEPVIKKPVVEEETRYDKLYSAKMPAQTPWNTVPDCEHVYIHLQEIPEEGVDIKDSCSECTFSGERRYACLSCYFVGCADQINGHIRKHAFLFGHPLIISYEDLSIYCFGCKRYLSGSELDEYRNIFQLKKDCPTESDQKIN